MGQPDRVALHARVTPETISPHLDEILAAADAGSVIAKDQAIYILLALAKGDPERIFPVLLTRLSASATNQLPMYSEKIAPVLPNGFLSDFVQILTARLGDEMGNAKRKRVEKILKSLI